MVWEKMDIAWKDAQFAWDETEVIFVTGDNGEMRVVRDVLLNVMKMWDKELERVGL